MIQPVIVPICKGKVGASTESTPPLCNTGVLKPEISLRIDNVKFRFHQTNFRCPIEDIGVKLFRQAIRRLDIRVRGSWSIPTKPEPALGSNYDHRISIMSGDEVRATIEWGGVHQNGWVQFELTGAFCRLMTRRAWIYLFRALCKYQGNILRADLAIDDLHGLVFDLSKIDEEFRGNPFLFIPGYRKGGHKLPRKWIESETGNTLYIGKRASRIYQRIYEKGEKWRSEGADMGKKYPNCVRWEIEFKRQKGEIDNHLVHPDYWLEYALGASRYLANLWGREGLKATWTPERDIDPTPERAAKALLALFKQWGPTIGHLAKIYGSEGLIRRISRDGESGLESLTPYDQPLIDQLMADLRANGVCGSSPEGAGGPSADDLPDW